MNEVRVPARAPHLMILGSRGIPACHGGFETFAERLALYLVGRGWRVTVYCQVNGDEAYSERAWRGIDLVRIPASGQGAIATILFDLKATIHACRHDGLVLTLGYNTAVFFACYRWRGRTNIVNMDGIEWRRSKWSLAARAWLLCNERIAAWLANHLIADNPGIEAHLVRFARAERISMIPYGADRVDEVDISCLEQFGLQTDGYALDVARAEPENSILEIVQAFCRRPRGLRLVVVGRYDSETNAYQRRVIEAASDEALFPGAIYDQSMLAVLRRHARLYLHGHQVGGTNPSLVESLAAGNAVLAYDNPFNRWVTGDKAAYFGDAAACAEALDMLLDDHARLAKLGQAAAVRHLELFQWPAVLKQYEELLGRWASGKTNPPANPVFDGRI